MSRNMGEHILANLSFPAGYLNNKSCDWWKDKLHALADRIGLHPLGSMTHDFITPPGAVSVCVLLSESHITVHTWPEMDAAALDVYHCRKLPVWAAHHNWLFETLGATDGSLMVVSRDAVRERGL